MIAVLQGQPFYCDDLYLLNLFLDKKKLIVHLMLKICIIKRKLYQVIEHLRKRRKYSKMDKRAKDKLVRSPRENG